MKKLNAKHASIIALIGLLTFSSTLFAKGPQRMDRQKTTVWMTELDLNTQQMKSITQLRESTQSQVMPLRQENRRLEKEIKTLRRADQSQQVKIKALRQSVRSNEEAIRTLQTNQHAQIRVLLTADQQIKFDQLPGSGSRKGGNGFSKNQSGRGNGDGMGRPRSNRSGRS